MQVRTFGEAEFRALGKRLAKTAQGKVLRKQLNKRIREAMKPAVADVQRAIHGMSVRGVRGHGTARRARAYAVNRPRGRVTAHGLRATVARGVKSRVKFSGYTVGARLYMDTSHMTNKQRTLPKHLDDPGGWRHPVWGHRTKWVRQYGTPYWDRTLRRHHLRMRKAVMAAVEDTLKEVR